MVSGAQGKVVKRWRESRGHMSRCGMWNESMASPVVCSLATADGEAHGQPCVGDTDPWVTVL